MAYHISVIAVQGLPNTTELQMLLKKKSPNPMSQKIEHPFTCPTPLTFEEVREIAFRKEYHMRTVAFRMDTVFHNENIRSIGVNLDTVLPCINFIGMTVDFEEATFFRNEADLLAYEQYHDVIVPIGEIEMVGKDFNNAEITAAYTKAINAAEIHISSIRSTYEDTMTEKSKERKTIAITRLMELLSDARQILEGNSIITQSYLDAK
jgi:hypothetical protein